MTTKILRYQGMNFYLTDITVQERIYQSLDELTPLTIKTCLAEYDGALLAGIDERLRESEDDDLFRVFDWITGDEE